MNNLQITEKIGVRLERGRSFSDQFDPHGRFDIIHLNPLGLIIGEYHVKNGLKTEGKNKILDVMFHSTTQLTTWYIGLMDASGFTSDTSASDSLSSHSGWSEFTSYSGGRQEWTEGSASSGVMTNASPVSFSITGTGSVQGIFVCSVASGTSGTLWSSGQFVAPVSVGNGDQLKITYTISC